LLRSRGGEQPVTNAVLWAVALTDRLQHRSA
jgi:hypothetical protein